MKYFFFFIFVLSFSFTNAQKVKQDLSKAVDNPARKEILEALKSKLQPQLKLKPKLLVKQLSVKGGFAYYAGEVRNENGQEIDFRKTSFREAVQEGLFDGPNTNALLKKVQGKWKVLTYSIGPTDVPWGCWWKEFKAPKEIFDYAEEDCSWVGK